MEAKEKIFTNELRNDLKEVIQKELQQLTKQLEILEPKERLSVVCKLLPYVFPKVETVHLKEGEPYSFN